MYLHTKYTQHTHRFYFIFLYIGGMEHAQQYIYFRFLSLQTYYIGELLKTFLRPQLQNYAANVAVKRQCKHGLVLARGFTLHTL